MFWGNFMDRDFSDDPQRRLAQAIEQGNIKAMKQALLDGADAKAPGLLRKACDDLQAPSLIRELLRHGARRAQGELDELTWACQEGCWLAAEALATDAQSDFGPQHLLPHGDNGNTLAMALAALASADALSRLIAQQPEGAGALNANGFDAFWIACEGGGVACAKLLEPLARPRAPYGDGSLPLDSACKLGEPELAGSLLARGADPRRVGALGRQPLHWAAQGGSAPCCEALLALGADPLATDENGHTPADIALAHGRTQARALLLAFAERIVLDAEAAAGEDGSRRGGL